MALAPAAGLAPSPVPAAPLAEISVRPAAAPAAVPLPIARPEPPAEVPAAAVPLATVPLSADPAAAAGASPEGGASPWFADQRVDAGLLPSASILQSTDAAAPQPMSSPQLPPTDAAPHMRMGFVVALALAALLLVGALLYLVLRPASAGDGPTSVKVGSENREYQEEPAATASAAASASATAVAPRPAYRPPAKPSPKPTARVDIYENME